MTNELQKADRDWVWERIRSEEPTFLESYDPTDNYHTVREIVLGGSTTWGYCNSRYKAKPGDRVMDVGASVGIYAAWCASRGADVVAYECALPALEHLNKAATVARFVVMPMAVRSKEGIVRYYGHVGRIGEVSFYNGGVEGTVPWAKAEQDGSVEVYAASFDHALGGRPWDMVKIDIEGGEADLLLNTPESSLLLMRRAYVELHPWVSQANYDAILALCGRLWECVPLGSTPEGRFDAVYLEEK